MRRRPKEMAYFAHSIGNPMNLVEGSPEWRYHQAFRLYLLYMNKESEPKEWAEQFSLFIEAEPWKYEPMSKYYDSAAAMIEAEVGCAVSELEPFIAMADTYQPGTRARLEPILRGVYLEEAEREAREKPEQGGRPKETVSNTYSSSDASERNSSSGTLRRLTRKAQAGDEQAAKALAQYQSGEISVHQAAIQTGMRKKRASVRVERQAVVDWINRTFSDDDILWIIEELQY